MDALFEDILARIIVEQEAVLAAEAPVENAVEEPVVVDRVERVEPAAPQPRPAEAVAEPRIPTGR